jgi:hypothetical protein
MITIDTSLENEENMRLIFEHYRFSYVKPIYFLRREPWQIHHKLANVPVRLIRDALTIRAAVL